MKFTDVFINRPVLATVVSLLIFVAGVGSFFLLSVQEYPTITSTTITVTTNYPGANASTIKALITQPLAQSISSADGINYMTSTTLSGMSIITCYIDLNYPPAEALTNISAKVNAVLSILPKEATNPVIDEETGDTFPLMFLNFSSSEMDIKQITAYVANVVMPELYSVSGISDMGLWGGQDYAMRIWLNPLRMAGLGVTPSEVTAALQNNNMQSTPGELETKNKYINIFADTNLFTPQQFDNLVVKNQGDQLIRIKDIGYAALGKKEKVVGATYNGKNSMFLTINAAPTANPLTVIDGVYGLLPSISSQLPADLHATVAYDSTQYIRQSIREVLITIFEAVLIVVVVIFLFLGAIRSVLIPVVTIPLSLVGVFFLMYLMGFSINLLTLLAMVLAIGLVVDDAIVVLENIYRHLEEGQTPLEAAKKGAREIGMPIVVMTLTLAAVYAPIGFIGGVTGALFIEFAFTLAATVIISGIIALTFSPMMCSKLISKQVLQAYFVKKIDKVFEKLKTIYQELLHKALNNRAAILTAVVAILCSCYFMYSMIPSELSPQEDQSFIGVLGQAPATANYQYMQKYGKQAKKIFDTFPGVKSTYVVYGFPEANQFLAGMFLKSPSERDETQMEIAPQTQEKVNKITGVEANAFQRPVLPGTPYGPSVSFVLTTTGTYEHLYNVMLQMQNAANKSGLFTFIKGNLTFNNPQVNVQINRSKAAAMGISMKTIGDALNTVLSDAYSNYFQYYGYSFEVIPQAIQKYRSDTRAIGNIHVETNTGQLVPLSSVISFKNVVEPATLTQFQQLNSATLLGNMAPGVTLGTALTYLQNLAKKTLPKDVTYNYSGASRLYIQEGNSIMYAFGFAIILIFLMLAGRFESFRDPLIIMFTVPMSIFGALLPLFFGAGTINIYTQIGLVTLIGLITKHGILMVDFANQIRDEEGLSKREAIEKAAQIRLRPILMTTAAMVFGVVPLIFAVGAGAVSRNDIGYVIASGMSIGTLFTLFVIPTMYTFLSKEERKPIEK